MVGAEGRGGLGLQGSTAGAPEQVGGLTAALSVDHLYNVE